MQLLHMYESGQGLGQSLHTLTTQVQAWRIRFQLRRLQNNLNKTSANTKKSPSWEPDSYSASLEILLLLWNPKSHCRVRKNPSLDLVSTKYGIEPTSSHPISSISIPMLHSHVPLSLQCLFRTSSTVKQRMRRVELIMRVSPASIYLFLFNPRYSP
jgi:hypothetical protein